MYVTESRDVDDFAHVARCFQETIELSYYPMSIPFKFIFDGTNVSYHGIYTSSYRPLSLRFIVSSRSKLVQK
jgi:hypothetical protein